ncbi:MAG: hypothetical protein AAFR65_14615 [Pseudomonadota bacterium]
MTEIVTHLNAGNLWSLPPWSAVPRAEGDVDYRQIKGAGFTGIQHHWYEAAYGEAGLDYSGMLKITSLAEAKAGFERLAPAAPVHTTVHLGTGYESDAEALALIDGVTEVAGELGLAWSVETHRATLTQDPYRTLDLFERRPHLTFTADLSHWYTGGEMPYGDFSDKLERWAPVLARTRYMHLRVGDSCTMQLPLSQAKHHPCWDHYTSMWQTCLAEASKDMDSTETLYIAPELLPAKVEFGGAAHHLNYAKVDNDGEETSDRWTDALELVEHVRNIAREATRAS